MPCQASEAVRLVANKGMRLRRQHCGQNAARPPKTWRRPKILTAGIGLELFRDFQNRNSTTIDASGKVSLMGKYHSYHPSAAPLIPPDNELPVHYWFYIYTHSNESSVILQPFIESTKKCPNDKRVLCVMSRNKVRIVLHELEMYKSLPRRIVVVKAGSWKNLLNAMNDLELTLPEIMRYASYPVLMDTETHRFPSSSNCTNYFTRTGADS